MTKQRVLITSALLYANGPLHFGHIAGAYLPADCYARFERMQGKQVLFISGSDEYGVAITLSAEKEKVSPQAHVDKFHAINERIFQQLNISFDHYSRTTCALHVPVVHAFFQDLYQNGYVQAEMTQQLFSEADGRFLADRYVVGTCPKCGYDKARGDECGKCGASYEALDLKQPRSKLTGALLIKKTTRHWYLRFDLFKQQLETFLAARQWKPNVVKFAKQYVEELLPRSITRDLDWGVSVPLEEAKDKVFYVWFDAPIGYISATQDWAHKVGKPAAWEEYWLSPETHYVQFIGKDNIPFHAVFFPAMIMGQNRPYKLVDELVANEFYNLEGRQFSKSEGWTIDLEQFLKEFTADQIRYVIAANSPETADSEFTWKDFQQRCNAELVGKLGNFINRVLAFIHSKLQGQMPVARPLEAVDQDFLKHLQQHADEIKEHYAHHRLRKVASSVMDIAQLANTFFDQKTPWKDIKDPACTDRLQNTLALCLEAAKYLAIVSLPLMPTAAQAIWQLLGQESDLKEEHWDRALQASLTAKQLKAPYLIFQKVEDDMIEQQITKLNELNIQAQEPSKANYKPLKPQISIEQCQQLDLRIGTILEAEKVAKSKKLLLLTVDIGLEKRKIVSGISLHYAPEQLVGKKVVVIANLQPATLMGIESQGMILAGSLDAALELVTVNNLPSGAEVS